MNSEEILNQKMMNLYKVLLDYYSFLSEKEHPKIPLITDIMDKLIELRKSQEPSESEFQLIHSLAFNRIKEIYDFDAESQEVLSEA